MVVEKEVYTLIEIFKERWIITMEHKRWMQFVQNSWRKMDLRLSFLLWCGLNISGVQNIFFPSMFVSQTIFWKAMLIKILHFIFVFILVHAFYQLFKQKDSFYGKQAIYLCGIYFVITFIILLLVWPGTWSWDDIGVLDNAHNYAISSWQHMFSQIFMDLCLQTIPFPSGVMIVQLVIASLIVGWSIPRIVFLVVDGGSKRVSPIKYIIAEGILLLPFLFPPILEYILSGFRMGIYSFLEFFLVTKLFVMYKLHETDSMELLEIFVLTVIIATWRSEAAYYVICVPILVYNILEYIDWKKIAVAIAICVLLVTALGKINASGENSKYSLTATLLALPAVVQASDPIKDADELTDLKRVIDIELIYQNKDWYGGRLFWSKGFVRENYSREDWNAYLKATVTLLMRYPQIAIGPMYDMFKQSAGVAITDDGRTPQISSVINIPGGALSILDDTTEAGKWWSNVNAVLKNGINENIRQQVLLLLACTDADAKIHPLYLFFWNLLIPLSFLVMSLLVFLYRRKKILSFLVTIVLIRVLFIFVTEPGPYIMYFLSTYLIGYEVFLSILIWAFFGRQVHYDAD